MTVYDITTADSFSLKTKVMRGGAPMPLTGATVVARASDGETSIIGSVDTSDSANGWIGALFAAGAFAAGNWEVQVRVSLAGETQTVARSFVRVSPAV